MYASTSMTRVATLEHSWRRAALRVLGVIFGALVLLIALMMVALPRPAAAATLQAVPAIAFAMPQSADQDLVQPAGFFEKGGHFGGRGHFKKHRRFGGFRAHRGIRGHGRFRKGFHGRHGNTYFGHGKRFYRK